MEDKAGLNYLVAGAGGTGGSIAGMMARAGKNVTLIARGDHLEALKNNGMTLINESNDGSEKVQTFPVDAVSAEEYVSSGSCPDVIFICTKSYSVKDIAPFIDAVADDHTIIIPILNGIRMEDYIRKFIHSGRATDGCIYIYGMKDGPGRIRIIGEFFRIVFGPAEGFKEEGGVSRSELEAVEKDLKESGIRTMLTDDILTETIRKFSYNTPAGGTMLYFDSFSGKIRETPEQLDFFVGMVREIEALGAALGAKFDKSLVEGNLNILNNSGYDTTTSLVRDIRSGHVSEFETLIKIPRELGGDLGVEMPHFDKVISKVESSSENN